MCVCVDAPRDKFVTRCSVNPLSACEVPGLFPANYTDARQWDKLCNRIMIQYIVTKFGLHKAEIFCNTGLALDMQYHNIFLASEFCHSAC